MAGLINRNIPNDPAEEQQEPVDNQQEEQAEPDAEGAAEPNDSPAEDQAEPGGGAVDQQQVRQQNMARMPQDLQAAYERVVLAGMKTIFSPQTHEMALKSLQGQGPIDQRLGAAIAGLMGMLVKESNGTMPPQVIIPAGVELLTAAADYLQKSGTEQISNEQIGDAVGEMIAIILHSANVPPDQIEQMVSQFQEPQGDEAAGEPPGNEPQGA